MRMEASSKENTTLPKYEFSIDRASRWYKRSNGICEEAYHKDDDPKTSYVQFSNLQELLNFIAKVGAIVIDSDNSIVIYDDYIE